MRFHHLTLFLLLLAGCHGKHIATGPEKYAVVHRGGYAYQRINDGELVVAAVSEWDLKAAMKEIGCGTKYICLVQRDGELFNVQQRQK
jgi:hypothetical protein